jgi:ubiquitin carboxyl-terminal hydrolase 5/13
MASLASVLPTVRGEFSKLKAPGPHDKVYNDECMYSFDSPFSDTGLYVSMSTWMGYGEDFYLQDAARTGNKLYVHLKWTQVPLAASAPAAASSASASASASESAAAAPEEAVTKLAIGVGGGFVTEARFDIVKEHALVVVCDNGPQRVPLPHAELPEFVSNVAMAIIDHNGMKSKMQVTTWTPTQ